MSLTFYCPRYSDRQYLNNITRISRLVFEKIEYMCFILNLKYEAQFYKIFRKRVVGPIYRIQEPFQFCEYI